MKNYLMIGAGGTGTHFIADALPYLDKLHRDRGESSMPKAADWLFVIIDGDDFEEGNLERQLFEPGFMKTNKATAMAQMYNRYPVMDLPRFIGREDLQKFFNNGDTVFICADNHSIRALIEERALELDDCVVINAGNEMHDGNVQLWVREKGENITPRLSFLHPEIIFRSEEDRSEMTCAQAAALPGGGQIIIANQWASAGMMAALYRYDNNLYHQRGQGQGWTEMQYDLNLGQTFYIDMRDRNGWQD